MVLKEKTNEEIHEEIKGIAGRMSVAKYTRRYRALFGITRLMTDSQRETIERMAIQDRDNRRVLIYAKREGIIEETAARHAAKARKKHRDSL